MVLGAPIFLKTSQAQITSFKLASAQAVRSVGTGSQHLVSNRSGTKKFLIRDPLRLPKKYSPFSSKKKWMSCILALILMLSILVRPGQLELLRPMVSAVMIALS